MNPLVNIIKSIITSKTQAGEMFTAFDITTLVRATGETVKHAEVKTIVHDLMKTIVVGGTYQGQLRAFGVLAFPAIVYFPQGADVSTYDPNAVKRQVAQVPNVTSTLPSQPVATTAVVNAPSSATGTAVASGITVVASLVTPSATKTIKVGRGNRVRIPADSIRKLGLKSGDRAYVAIDGTSLSISAAQPVGKTAKSYTVDEYDNLLFRVPNADAFAANGFSVSAQNSKVVLEAN